jgi:hypothetical protein
LFTEFWNLLDQVGNSGCIYFVTYNVHNHPFFLKIGSVGGW